MRTKYQRKSLRRAVLVALSAGVVASPTAFGLGFADPGNTAPFMIAQEDVSGAAPTTGITVPGALVWEMGVTRTKDQNIQVRYTLDPEYSYVGAPTLAVTAGAGAAPVMVFCNLSTIAKPGTQEYADFDCTLPDATSVINIGNHLELTGVVLDQDGVASPDLCATGATIGMEIEIFDNTGSPPFNSIDGTLGGISLDRDPLGGPSLGIIQIKPASRLFASSPIGEPDAGDTSTDVFSLPTPLTAFVPMPGAPSDSAERARANYIVERTTKGIWSLDGTGDYVLAAADLVDLVISDPQGGFGGLDALCINGTTGGYQNGVMEECPGGANREFIDIDKPAAGPLTAEILDIPGDATAVLGATENVVYNANGDDPMGVSRVLGMTGNVLGNKGCQVDYANYDGWWPWKSNAFILEAHNVEREARDAAGAKTERHVYTLTNNCPSPLSYYVFVGNGKVGANGVSCGSPTAPGSLTCTGVIPAAVAGQPGNITKSITTITAAADNRDMTARFVIAGPPNCAHGAYEEEDLLNGNARKITVMERDFGDALDN